MAPIFDRSSSMACDRVAASIANEEATTCKPFKKLHSA